MQDRSQLKINKQPSVKTTYMDIAPSLGGNNWINRSNQSFSFWSPPVGMGGGVWLRAEPIKDNSISRTINP